MNNQKIIGVDVGNTSIKTAEFFESEIGEIVTFKNLADVGMTYPNARFIVSSVGRKDDEIKLTLNPELLIDENTPLPISLDYDTPETLGSDRIAAAVGAWQLYPDMNILIIDGGTCITYDVVTDQGFFLGGMISPGLEMRLKAMNHYTNGLPMVELKNHDLKKLIGKSTKESMISGAVNGLKFEIQGVLQSFNKKYDHLQVVVTGGLELDFESTLKAPIFASSKIVLDGMHAISKFNEVN